MEEEFIEGISQFIPSSGTKGGILLYRQDKGRYTTLTGLLSRYIGGRRGVRAVREVPVLELSFTDPPPFLRDYQKEAVNSALKYRRATLQLPTGSGKSFIIGALCSVFAPHYPIIISVPLVSLLHQLSADIESYLSSVGLNIPIGLVGGGKHLDDKTYPIVVGTPRSLITLASKYDMSRFGVWIADECHTLANLTGVSLSSILSGTCYRIGLSATPSPTSGSRVLLDGILGPIKFQVKEQDMIGRDIIMSPEVVILPTKMDGALERVRKMGKSAFKGKALHQIQEYSSYVYNLLYQYLIVENEERNELIATTVVDYLRQSSGDPIVIIVRRVSDTKTGKAHASLIQDALRAKGIELPIIKGGSKVRETQSLIDQLKRRAISGVIAGPSIISTGVNIPSLGALVLAAGQRSEVELVQRIGRVLRYEDGKAPPKVFDFDDPYGWFQSQAKARQEVYRKVYGIQPRAEVSD